MNHQFNATVVGYRITYDCAGERFEQGSLTYPARVEEVPGCKLEAPAGGGYVTPLREEAERVLKQLRDARREKLQQALAGIEASERDNG